MLAALLLGRNSSTIWSRLTNEHRNRAVTSPQPVLDVSTRNNPNREDVEKAESKPSDIPAADPNNFDRIDRLPVMETGY